MALDGFSLSNLGFPPKLNSAQLSTEAEQLAQAGRERSLKDVDGMSRKQASIEKQDLSESGSNAYHLSHGDSGTSENQDDDEIKEEFDDNNFIVKLNTDTQLIELIDNNTSKIIETITPENLTKLVANLNSASGIIVNKKI